MPTAVVEPGQCLQGDQRQHMSRGFGTWPNFSDSGHQSP